MTTNSSVLETPALNRPTGPLGRNATTQRTSPKRARQTTPELVDGPYRFVDEAGNEYWYRHNAHGGCALVRCIAENEDVSVPCAFAGQPLTAIDREAFASSLSRMAAASAPAAAPGQPGKTSALPHRIHFLAPSRAINAQLKHVVLPNGVRAVGRAAFRGCANLSEVILPDTLESIDDLAFSCTGIASLELPACCTHLAPRALRLGPETVSGDETPYRSKLANLSVEAENPTLRMIGGVLCRSIGAGRFEALLCADNASEVVLPPEVERILPGAFAGTAHIGTLSVAEGTEVLGQSCLLPAGTCTKLVIQLARRADEHDQVTLGMPGGELSRRVLAAIPDHGHLEAKLLTAAYDAALLDMGDRLDQAKLMLSRLAAPVLLSPETHRTFIDVLEREFEPLCIHFGARSFWHGYELMVDVGLLDAGRITEAITMLTAHADTLATAYLLQLKRTRFEKGGWDYDL